MRGLKRSRDGNNDGVVSQDICSLMRRAREQAAMRTSGPFFIERALFPRLLPCGYHFTDPTRTGSRDSRGVRHFARISPPQRTVTVSQLLHYKRMDRHALYTVVPPSPTQTALTSAVTDIVFDVEEQFALVCQPQRLSAYATEDWMNRKSADALVSVEARLPDGVRPSARFGFNSAQFLGSSLHVAVAYHGAPVVDVFDLEDVDEATSAPQQRFALPDAAAPGDGVGAGAKAYASDVVGVTEHLGLAALSSGLAVWLDRRSGKAEPCTGLFAREYGIGQGSGCVGGRTVGEGPLSAIAFLCREDPINVLCGTVRGAVQLWDVRCAREYVAVHQTANVVCRLHPSFHPDRRGLVWLNNYAGEVQSLCVSKSGGIHLVAAAHCADGVRSSATFNLPPPRITSIESIGLLACPHVSSNSLFLFDTNGLFERSKNHSSMLSLTVPDPMRSTLGTICVDDDDSSEETDEENESNSNIVDMNMNLTAGSTRGFVTAQSMSSSMPDALHKKANKSSRDVANIPHNNVISYDDDPNVTACAAWSKYGRLVVGASDGRVEIA